MTFHLYTIIKRNSKSTMNLYEKHFIIENPGPVDLSLITFITVM